MGSVNPHITPVATGTGPAQTTGSSGTGGVDSKHPEWNRRITEWTLMRDTSEGETVVKDKGQDYLSLPGGFRSQSDGGTAMYTAYQKRAQFPDIVNPTIMGMVGLIHRKESIVKMPDSMLPVWERATKDGLSLEALHRKITYELVGTGRISLLVDANPASLGGSELPFVTTYTAEELINWSETHDFYVLNESRYDRDADGFAWTWQDHWRVLKLQNNVYSQQVFDGLDSAQDIIVPTAKGNRALDVIPIVVINARQINEKTEVPPLLGVARCAVGAYQLDADYRHQLYSTGQETLFCFNMDAPEHVGAGTIVTITPTQSKDNHPADAKYVGPSGSGIAAHKVAIDDKFQQAAKYGARVFDTVDNKQESGDAKKIRYIAETATLMSIAMASAQGLEKALRLLARMMGLSQSEQEGIVVTPDLSFMTAAMSPTEALALVQAWQAQGISYDTLYDNLRRGEIASPERTAEEEFGMIVSEADQIEQLIAARVPPKPFDPNPKPTATGGSA